MTCTYTGARVYFKDYGFIAPADLYSVGNTVIIRWNAEGKDYVDDPSYEHAVTIGFSGFHRDDLGITVVPESQFEGRVYR